MQTAQKTPLPQLDYSPREEEYIEGLQLPQHSSKPQYRVFAACQRQESSHMLVRSETSLDIEEIASTRPLPRDTPTQDLAEFLRTSKPEDYKRFLKESSMDDVNAHGPHKVFRFLRKDAAHKDISRSTSSSLPNNVLPKITSRGKPYLQIHVDYAKTYFQSNLGTPETDKKAGGFIPSEVSEFNYRNSMISSSFNGADSFSGSPRPSSAGDRPVPSLSPAPWNVRESRMLYGQALETCHNSSHHTNGNPAPRGECKSRSLSIAAVGGGGPPSAKRREVEDATVPKPSSKTPPQSPTSASSPSPRMRTIDRPGTAPPIPVRSSSLKHGRKKSREKATRPSTHSEVLYENSTDAEFDSTARSRAPQRKSAPTVLPQPGPPPTKKLPSLPKDQAPGASVNKFGCATSLSEVELIRQTREQRVRARKARDIQQIRMKREKKPEKSSYATENGDQKLDYSSSAISGTDVSPSSSIRSSSRSPRQLKHAVRRRDSAEAPVRASLSPITVILDEQPAPLADAPLKGHAMVGSSTPPRPLNLQFTTPSEDRNRPPASPVGSPIFNSDRRFSTSTASGISAASAASAKELELESRMAAIERKNKMLEQALMAVIRGSICQHEQRRTEIHKANALEDLLRELRCTELGTPVPTAVSSSVHTASERVIA